VWASCRRRRREEEEEEGRRRECRTKNKNPTQRCGEQFCETSFKNGKLSAELTASY